MSWDGIEEEVLILARAQTLAGGRFYDYIPDEANLAIDETTNAIRPYGTIFFGSPFPSLRDRSLGGETEQPLVMPVRFECWGATRTNARDLAGGVKRIFLDWAGNDNMTPMAFAGGGSFRNGDNSGSPTRFMVAVHFETTINMSVAA